MKTIDKKLRDPYHYIYETYIVNKDIDLNDIKSLFKGYDFKKVETHDKNNKIVF